jgi:hypothetical protein
MNSVTFINSRARRQNLALRPRRDYVSDLRRLRLLPSGDGWSLVSLDGRLVFSALGLSGRQRCLEFAQAHGTAVLASV